MSMFRKPTKRIQRRVFTADDEEEDDSVNMETSEPKAPPPPQISKQKVKDKPKSKPTLSFADEEEEEVEVFRVKKSSQSKRLARLRQREQLEESQKKVTGNGDTLTNSRELQTVRSEKTNDEIVLKAVDPPKKKRDLEGVILSGRYALAAEGDGDLSDSDQEKSPDETDEGGFHRFRADSVRAAIDKGGIPDAALIHAARKSRQKARETGRTDYIPLRRQKASPDPVNDDTDVPRRHGGGGRLVREDGSGDEDEDAERIHVRGVMPQESRKPAPETTAIDSGGEEWEEQQMSKAKSTLLHPAITMGELPDSELNPFAFITPNAPPAPHLPIHAVSLRIYGEISNADQLVNALGLRLKELCKSRDECISRADSLKMRQMELAEEREKLKTRTPLLDRAYRRAQAMRSYITDLTECIDEKMPALESLEARALALHKWRCEYVVERRRTDVRDQAQDLLALAARPGAAPPPEDPSRTRRVAEREGRRRARRLVRETLPHAQRLHRDGDSSDDELPPSDLHPHTKEREELASECRALFADAARVYGSLEGVCRRLAAFRRKQPDAYSDSYCSHALPKLLAPFVRAELIMWNPLADENNEDFEKMDWYKCLMMYGVRGYEQKVAKDMYSSSDSYSSGDESTDDSFRSVVDEASVQNDPDLMLVPTIIEKVLVPKITELISSAWDPVCVRSCVRLRAVCSRICSYARSEAVRPLASAVLQVLKKAAQHDLFLPALPAQLYEGKGGVYWRRCLGAAVRLLRATLALSSSPLDPVATQIADKLIQGVIQAAGVCGGAAAAEAAGAVWGTLPGGVGGRGGLAESARPKLRALAEKAIQDIGNNPLQLKSIEIARTVLSQANAAKS